MKIYLDDLREAPAGWIKVTHPDEVISHIRKGEAEIVDLDYHLGNDRKYTGLTVLKWLQHEIGEGYYPAQLIALLQQVVKLALVPDFRPLQHSWPDERLVELLSGDPQFVYKVPKALSASCRPVVWGWNTTGFYLIPGWLRRVSTFRCIAHCDIT